MSKQSIKEYIQQRKSDLIGNDKKADQLLETEAMRLVYEDLSRAAMVAEAVVSQANGGDDERTPPVNLEDLIQVATLIQAYLAPAYRTLVANKELPAPELTVVTAPPSGIKKPGDLVS